MKKFDPNAADTGRGFAHQNDKNHLHNLFNNFESKPARTRFHLSFLKRNTGFPN